MHKRMLAPREFNLLRQPCANWGKVDGRRFVKADRNIEVDGRRFVKADRNIEVDGKYI